jgi:hypothetical protein
MIGFSDALNGITPAEARSNLSSKPDTAHSRLSRFTKRGEQLDWVVSLLGQVGVQDMCWFTAVGLHYLPWLQLRLLKGPISFAEFWRTFASRNMLVTASENSPQLEIEEAEDFLFAWIH